MASILPRFLFFSLLLHSILLVNCDEEDDLLRGINQYRTSLSLTPLNSNDRVECLADEIADRTFNDRPCPSSSGPNGPPGSEPPVTDYPDLITKCRLDANVTRGAIVLPVCVPRLEPGQVLSSYTMSRYAGFLNDTRFSDIGIGSDDDWIVVVLTMSTSTGSFLPGSGDEEDVLLQGINQYRTSQNLTALIDNDRVECLADEVADRVFNNQPCTNSSGPNGPPGSEPKVSDYPDIITKCRLNANDLQNAQILPVCVPRLQPGPVLSNYTMSRYAAYLNDTRFSNIGIGSEDDWIVVVLTTSTSNGSFSPGNGSFTPGNDDEEDVLLQGINQYRTSQNLRALIDNDRVECLADEVADRVFNNQPCTNSSGPNGPPGSEPKVSDYPDIITKCRLNANDLQNAQILPVCVPRLQPGPVLSNYTMSRYAAYLNDTRFSNIGIGSEDDWIVVVLTMSTSTGSFSPGNGSFTPGNDDEEDVLLQGINQYRTSQNLTALIDNDRVECLADEVADRVFNNQPCTNSSGPNGPPGSEPKISDYPDIITKCRLNTNAVQDAQVLPVCVPRLQRGPVLSNYTMSRYAAYLNDTRFSAIGIGSEDDWIVVVLTTSTPNGSFSPGSGSPGSGFGNGASGTVPVNPIYFLVIGLFFFLF